MRANEGSMEILSHVTVHFSVSTKRSVITGYINKLVCNNFVIIDGRFL